MDENTQKTEQILEQNQLEDTAKTTTSTAQEQVAPPTIETAQVPEPNPTQDSSENQDQKVENPEEDEEQIIQERGIIPKTVTSEMKKAYITYAMSVIVGRALPDVRDGFKPVHRRILYGMYDLGMLHNKPSKKCARIVGEVLGKYHPHGDSSVYDALVRMAQDFSLRYPLIRGQGNFGCFTADTKVKLTDGRNLSFKELVKEHKQGKINFTYTVNKQKKVEVAEIIKPRLTKKDAELVKITLDSGEEIRCTPDHRFMLRSGEYKEAKDLKPQESLMPTDPKLTIKLAKVEPIDTREDVYDLTINTTHNFALASGVFVHNSIDGDNAAAMRYCVTGDTLILTNKGLLPIKDLGPKERINIEILNYKGKKSKASKFFDSGKHKTIRLITEQGYEITGSYNHPLMCFSKNEFGMPTLKWKLLKDITEDDHLILNRGQKLFAKTSPSLKKHHPKSNKKKKQIKLPAKMTKELAFLLGALVSEGSFHQNKVIFNNSDMIFYNKVKDCITKSFPKTTLYEREVKGNCKELDFYHQRPVNFLINIGLKKARSDGKEIPKTILESPKPIVAAFLQGLFEGDGSITVYKDKRNGGKAIELAYHSKSKTLIKQLKILLLNLGIVTTHPYTDKRNGCFKLIISGAHNIQTFKNEINFFSKKKKDKLSEVETLNKYRMSRTDYIPFLSTYLRANYKVPFINRYNFDRYNNLNKNYEILHSLLKPADQKLIEWLKNKHYFINKVKTIKKQEKPETVYSIKVDSDCHSFTANGFVNHNTEAKLNKIAEEMLNDIKKDTVNFKDNFDASLKEPTVLPAKIPNLLMNGSSGIAVGMATNIPPHNLNELCDAATAIIDNPEINISELIKIVPGPDFPTGAKVYVGGSLHAAYAHGKGRVIMKSVATVEDKKIIVTEIPYQVNKADMIIQIANLVKEKRVEGISDINDESDRDGIRVVIKLKSNADGQIVLNQLYKYSNLKTSFSLNMLSLVDNVPKVLGLKQMLEYYIKHREEVVIRRTQYELNQAQKRLHILEGLLIALINLDEVIPAIRNSQSAEQAKQFLMNKYSLSEIQAKAILDLKLQKLAALERERIKNEHDELLQIVTELKAILASKERIYNIIKTEIQEVKEQYGGPRRSEIIFDEDDTLDIEDLIEEEQVAVTLTNAGYLKRIPIDTYKVQNRGGKGVLAQGMKDGDFVDEVFVCSTHAWLLIFTNKGKVHWIKTYKIPVGSRQAKGKHIANIVELKENEQISAIIPIKNFDEEGFLFFSTKLGTVKKTDLNSFSKPRNGGIRAIELLEEDQLVGVKFCQPGDNILIVTKNGYANRFMSDGVRAMGRTARGVRGIRLREKDQVVSILVASPDKKILTITKKGYGKMSPVQDYRLAGRGGKGVINLKVTSKNGPVVSARLVTGNEGLMLMSKEGIAIRIKVSNVPSIGRATQGVRVMRFKSETDIVAAVALIKDDGTTSDDDSETQELANEPSLDNNQSNQDNNQEQELNQEPMPQETSAPDEPKTEQTPQTDSVAAPTPSEPVESQPEPAPQPQEQAESPIIEQIEPVKEDQTNPDEEQNIEEGL